MNWRFLVGVAVVFGAMAAVTIVLTSGNEGAKDRSRSAVAACQEFVRRDLRAPATAEFPSPRLVPVEGNGDGPYTVTSSVDSQNGFGALVRSYFICTVQREGDNWRLTRLTL